MSATPITEAFLDAIRQEFPTFQIRPKRASRLQQAIGTALAVITCGGMRTYMTHYHTVLFGTLWVPDSWNDMSDAARYVLLRHERIHLRQRRRMGDAWMAFVYLVPYFPLGLAYGRARLEWEAYVETLRATAEVEGLENARALRSHLVERFVGPDYGWMWPFRGAVNRWFDEAIREIEGGDRANTNR